MTQDRVFGMMTVRSLGDFFVPEKVAQARQAIQKGKRVLVYGVGAILLAPGDVLVYADITRWELQLRFRRGADNWRTARKNLPKLSKVKRGYFAEWRWGDKVKKACLPRMDFYLDTTTQGSPALVAGADYRAALEELAHRPFRMAPYYDPGVWGGDWMKNTFQLPENGSNYAWSFDGVPEENSLLLGFGPVVVETPAVNLVFSQPRALLGERVHARFGTEFPIRFDMLDTIHGQNLSLQVHPLTEYIQEAFNMRYTQDESYYILDAQEGSSVWLGVREGVDPAAMEADTLYVGFWTDKGNADESTSDFLKQLHGKNIFLFGTAGFGGSKEYFDKILKKVEHSLDKSNTVFGCYMCQGKMPMSVRQRYEEMKKQPIHLPNLDAMIENFDKALSHPDADDLEQLKQAVR